ncbi:MAG: ParA family protein [Blastocatellia bacterium]|nr:ParA family protein [Blastocatellia bacterium]
MGNRIPHGIPMTICNHKGGSGKTTTACNLSAGLARLDFKTLLVDIDPQANATITFLDRSIIDIHLGHVFLGFQSESGQFMRHPFENAIYETAIPNLDLAASNLSLSKLNRIIDSSDIIELYYAVKEARKEYDFIIIDTPPNLGPLLDMALLASNYYIIPIEAAYYPLEGVSDLDETIGKIRRIHKETLLLLGALVTRFDQRTKICGQAYSTVAETFGDKAYETVIRNNTKLVTAPAINQSIYEHAPTSYGAEDYSNFVKETLGRLKIAVDGRSLIAVR